MGITLAESPEFKKAADENGWNLTNCRVAGAGIATPIITFKGTAICAALSGGEPISGSTCTGTLIASAGAITHIACTHFATTIF